MLEKGKYFRIDLLSTLVLYPVTTARKDDLAEVGDELLYAFDPSAHPRYLQDGVLVTPQKEGRLGNAGSTVSSEEFPVAINVAVPVEATAKSGALKLGCVHVEVRFG